MAKNPPDHTLPEDHGLPFSDYSQSLLIKNFNSIHEAVASRRFFFSSPGHSNSIVDSSVSTRNPDSDVVSEGINGCGIAVPTYSPDPLADFRRSMQEMVEASEVHDVRESWDYLQELLMCYLSLNPKSTHKFIVGAFADLLIGLMTGKGCPEKMLPSGE